MSSTESRAAAPTILSHVLRRASLVRALLLAVFLAGCGLYSIYLGADANWDLLNYHLYIPFAFLKARLGFDLQPAQAQTYLNPLLDLPFFLLIRHFNDYPRFVGFVQGATNGISLFCILILAWRLLGRVTGLSTWARVALFDVIANNADRKSGHCLFDANDEVWLIDHGLTFNVDHKLRTVIWDFSGDPLPPELCGDVERALVDLDKGALAATLDRLLSPAEVRMLERRLRGVLDPAWRFPEPTSAWSVPWPPI